MYSIMLIHMCIYMYIMLIHIYIYITHIHTCIYIYIYIMVAFKPGFLYTANGILPVYRLHELGHPLELAPQRQHLEIHRSASRASKLQPGKQKRTQWLCGFLFLLFTKQNNNQQKHGLRATMHCICQAHLL